MAECGMVCGIISFCGGGEQRDEPRDDIGKWDDLDEQNDAPCSSRLELERDCIFFPFESFCGSGKWRTSCYIIGWRDLDFTDDACGDVERRGVVADIGTFCGGFERDELCGNIA